MSDGITPRLACASILELSCSMARAPTFDDEPLRACAAVQSNAGLAWVYALLMAAMRPGVSAM